MAMTYNEDQSMLRDSAHDFMKSEAPRRASTQISGHELQGRLQP